MPRQPRFILPGQPQHVIVRGNNRNAVFRHHKDYLFFLEKLQEAVEKHDCDIHAYVLMTNHVHLLITPGIETGISKVMQSVGRSYVQFFNKKYKRTGTLWEGRFKAALIDSEAYALTCYQYIEQNPVRAKMVTDPGDYPWSSYHHNALGKSNMLVTRHDLYQRLATSSTARQLAYRALLNASVDDRVLESIRYATNHCWVLGDEKFKAEINALIDRPLSPQGRGGDRRSKGFNGV